MRMTCQRVAISSRDAGNLFLTALNRLLFPKTRLALARLRHNPGRVLILRSGNLGDTACALPALAAIRKSFPASHLCLLTSPGPKGRPEAREVLDSLNLVNEIITYYQGDWRDRTFRRALLKDLRRRDFDLFVLLPQGGASLPRMVRDLFFARLLGVGGALGFELAYSFPGFSPRALKGYAPRLNEVERLLFLLGRFGINGGQPFTLNLPPSCHRRAEELLQAYSRDGRPIVGLQIFAKAQANQWPVENFIELGKRLQETGQPLFVLFGGPGDRERLEKLAAGFPGDKLVAAGQASILETAALLARCHVLVTLDTGPMHLAALIGTPIVALFSARQFAKMWEPHTTKAVVLRNSVPCEPCFREDCDHLMCMQAISVEESFQATWQLLAP